MLRGPAEILAEGAEHDRARSPLQSRYRQYRGMGFDDPPVVATRIERPKAGAVRSEG